VLYFFAIMMSPDLSVFWSTWDIPLRIAAATLVLILPVASISVMLSSLTHESRFANFAWFAVWAVGHGAWVAILASVAFTRKGNPFDSAVMQHPVSEQWSVLSLYNNLGAVQSWVFGFSDFAEVRTHAIVLISATIVSLIILHNRISAPVRL
jgi:Kef-type K+ transport system membrane component KefB